MSDTIGANADVARLERNLRLVDGHAVLAGSLFWLPTMVLYTRSRFGLAGAVVISGLYYWFVVGQVFLAGGFVCLSGTDVSFHYDTLESLDRADDYQRRQSTVSARAYAAMADAVDPLARRFGVVSVLIGLGWGFVAALVVSALAVRPDLTDRAGIPTATR